MTAADYTPCVEHMITSYEGGYGWDRADPGGPTKYGVTCWDLAEHRGQRMTSMAAWAPLVKAMTLKEADDIYAKKYATATQFYKMQAGCDFAVFDFQVNSGVWGVRFAQKVVGVHIDGVCGPITLGAINEHSPVAFINELCDARMSFLRALPIWSVFKNGWTARVSDLRAYCIKLTKRSEPFMGQVEEETFTSRKEGLIPQAHAKAYPPEHYRMKE